MKDRGDTRSQYSANETLRDGRSMQIRALKRGDRAALLAAVGRISARSMYRRFFSPKRSFSEGEIAYFSNVNFTSHVALVVTVNEDGKSVVAGGGRYVVSAPGQAEVAFMVIDAYQGQGIGGALMRHLIVIAREAGLRELTAEVLSENAVMMRVFQKCGLDMTTQRHGETVHVSLRLG
jgi:RimJ/RimL family protein N-acetyltransferase